MPTDDKTSSRPSRRFEAAVLGVLTLAIGVRICIEVGPQLYQFAMAHPWVLAASIGILALCEVPYLLTGRIVLCLQGAALGTLIIYMISAYAV